MTFKDPSLKIPLINYIRKNSPHSRRAILKYIMEGNVHVNQQVIRDAQTPVSPLDTIIVANTPIRSQKSLYYMFHKPLNVISTFNDPNGRTDLGYYLKKYRLNITLKPIGRLDRHSSGLLLFSNDGQFIQTVLHPKFSILKRYQITLDKRLAPADKQRLCDGFFLDDGPTKMTISSGPHPTMMHVTIGIGRNRILRRSFEYLGYRVIGLHRTDIGPIQLGDLPAGQFSELSPTAIKTLVLE
ncbi:MAG: pseudouridine synthase [Candidatus Marinamargulisbacteria bacterium]